MIRTMHYNFSQNLLNTAARLTPSFGMAGTVLSLIKMFGHFESIEAIVPLITIALTSTLYGVVIANIIIVPLSAKLKDKTILSETTMQITIEGILAIQSMEDPLKVEDRMKRYQVRGDTANEKERTIMPHENALSVS
jgi:chemotaxis protein MotA